MKISMHIRSARHIALLVFEGLLWSVGVIAVGAALLYWSAGYFLQIRGAHELAELQTLKRSDSSRADRLRTNLDEGSVVGMIRIPRLEVASVIFEGTSERTLVGGVGHLRPSSFPDEAGNVVLAAHRDTYFRQLERVRPGDDVLVDTLAGKQWYTVESTEIVTPDRIDLLKATPKPTLTLVTCYPFTYLGRAPKRFIVRASPRESRDGSPQAALDR